MILLDKNVVSESLRKAPDPDVVDWLIRHDAELALPVVTIAELAYGIHKFHPDRRAKRLAAGLDDWRRRFSDRIFGLTEEAALAYGELMGAASRRGRALSAQEDGMIAAIALVNRGRLATRDTTGFIGTGVELIDPWEL